MNVTTTVVFLALGSVAISSAHGSTILDGRLLERDGLGAGQAPQTGRDRIEVRATRDGVVAPGLAAALAGENSGFAQLVSDQAAPVLDGLISAAQPDGLGLDARRERPRPAVRDPIGFGPDGQGPAAVPEPASLILLGSGLLNVAARMRRAKTLRTLAA